MVDDGSLRLPKVHQPDAQRPRAAAGEPRFFDAGLTAGGGEQTRTQNRQPMSNLYHLLESRGF